MSALLDDHALYRRGVVVELDDADDLEVVAEAADGQEAVEAAIALAPDVILMDVRVPGMDGIEACRRIIEATPTTRIIMLTVSDDADDLLDAVKAGAAGYVLKETSIADIADSVRRVAIGHSFVSPDLAGRVLDEFAAMALRESEAGGSTADPTGLTAREIAVLGAMADGLNDPGIASAVGLDEHAVRNHVRNILEKLELASRTEAVLFAMRDRLIDP
ncbi:MAG: response regulator transcription factor [Acidimicrobiales bacterium]|jgi:two-component system NarL family response regulator|nr:response regulator transcription factor [Acidimicrobiales bacterium]